MTILVPLVCSPGQTYPGEHGTSVSLQVTKQLMLQVHTCIQDFLESYSHSVYYPLDLLCDHPLHVYFFPSCDDKVQSDAWSPEHLSRVSYCGPKRVHPGLQNPNAELLLVLAQQSVRLHGAVNLALSLHPAE